MDLRIVAVALLAALASACTRAEVDPWPAEVAEPSSPHGERVEDRKRLAHWMRTQGIQDERVLAALERVPRHAFVPRGLAAAAYEDRALPIGAGQTISQPYVVAAMTAALELEPDSRVLEIGTGSGYQAAVLAELTPHVFTIEIVPELAERASAVLAELGYRSVQTRVGDGWLGWPEEAPFDAILVTAAPEELPAALVEQLAPGGRLVAPIGPQATVQELRVVTKLADGTLETRSLGAVRFVPMTGGGG